MKGYLQNKQSGDLFDAFNDIFRPMFYDEKLDSMRTDIRESESDYRLDIELPGFKKNEITVSLEDGYLNVGAEKAEKTPEGGDGKYLRRECRMSCRRSYYVGEDVEQENIKAKYENGILSLVVPKTQPKKIAAKTIVIE